MKTGNDYVIESTPCRLKTSFTLTRRIICSLDIAPAIFVSILSDSVLS